MKRTIPGLLALLLLATPPTIQAQWDYDINPGQTNTITLSDYFGSSLVVTAPTIINNRLATGFGDGVPVFNFFYPTGITPTNVTLPGSLTTIGTGAFSSCTGLSSIVIPAGVTDLGDYAFNDCAKLTGVYFNSNAPFAGPATFSGDHNVTAYYLPGTSGWDHFSTQTGAQVVPWNPLIQTGDASFGAQNGQFGFNITSTNNITVVVEACTNLASPIWTPLQTVTLTNGSFHFSEPLQTTRSGRYYRLSPP